MAIFKKKKEKSPEEEVPILAEREHIRDIVKQYEREEAAEYQPLEVEAREFKLESRQYRQFAGEQKKAGGVHTFYEKACRWAGRHLKVGVKEKEAEKLRWQLYSIGYHIEPSDVMSLGILVFLIFLMLGGFMILFSLTYTLVMVLAGLGMLIFVEKYPKYLADLETMDTMNMMPLAITYMVIYMRSEPILEGAVEFAAKHISGSLARDFRALLWQLQAGTYYSMDEALKDYAGQWVDRSKPFSQSIEVLRNSEKIGNEEARLEMLDQAAKIVLEGNLGTMKNFARSLRMPIIALYMLCIVLPVMGLVIAPVLTTLMAQSLDMRFLVLIYNVLLPFIVYALTKMVLRKRPGSFSQIDITNYPGLPNPGHFAMKTKTGVKNVPLLPIAILVFFIVSLPGLLMFIAGIEQTFSFANIIKSVFVTAGISAAIIVYSLGNSSQKVKVRKELHDLEQGLDVALYELGDRLSMGVPIETAIEDSAQEIKKGPMKGLFEKASVNMERQNMPLRQAFFDPRDGALVYYPSRLVRTIVEVLVESAKKGLQATSSSMMTISKYLKNLKTIKESITELIGTTTGAMKFQAQFLTAFITGIIISLDVLLFKILSQLGGQISTFSMPSDLAGVGVTDIFKNSMFNIASVVPAEYMQLVVGIYMIEVTVLLSMLINGTENGRDNISRDQLIGINLLSSTIIYVIVVILGTMIFTSFQVGV